jgi:hypothetical protein
MQPTTIRFEASDAEPRLLGTAALIVLETAEGRVAVQMTHGVFVALSRRMQEALAQSTEHAPRPKDA